MARIEVGVRQELGTWRLRTMLGVDRKHILDWWCEQSDSWHTADHKAFRKWQPQPDHPGPRTPFPTRGSQRHVPHSLGGKNTWTQFPRTDHPYPQTPVKAGGLGPQDLSLPPCGSLPPFCLEGTVCSALPWETCFRFSLLCVHTWILSPTRPRTFRHPDVVTWIRSSLGEEEPTGSGKAPTCCFGAAAGDSVSALLGTVWTAGIWLERLLTPLLILSAAPPVTELGVRADRRCHFQVFRTLMQSIHVGQIVCLCVWDVKITCLRKGDRICYTVETDGTLRHYRDFK
jgi:hypothetical protein